MQLFEEVPLLRRELESFQTNTTRLVMLLINYQQGERLAKLDGAAYELCRAIPPGCNITDHLDMLHLARDACSFEISLEYWAVEYFLAEIAQLIWN